MNNLRNSKNLHLWQEHGDNILVIQPFMDSVISGGDGCYLIDAEGKRILDLAAGQFCNILGYSHSTFINRLKKQIDNLIHIGDQYVSDDVLRAASRLAGIAPGDLDKVIFLSTGSEANECAMRMAKVATGRSGMLAFTRGYYGITLATRNLSSISDYARKVDSQPVPAEQYKLITPVCNRCPIKLEYPSCNTECIEVSLEMIAAHIENIAAVIVEPIISAGGMIFPPKDYLNKLYSITKEMGALFIADEAQTGFGRCGRWFDMQNYGLVPDILVVSKTAGNGIPAAAIIISNSLAKRLEDQGFTHLSSHQNDPLAAAAVHAVIDIVDDEKLIENSCLMGTYFMDKLNALQRRHPLIQEVRGRGLMIGLELDEKYREKYNEKLAFHFVMLCEEKSLHVTFSYFEPVIRFIPPLTISKNEIDEAIEIIDEVLDILESGVKDISGLIPRNHRSGPFIRNFEGRFSPGKILKKMWDSSPRLWVKKIKEIF